MSSYCSYSSCSHTPGMRDYYICEHEEHEEYARIPILLMLAYSIHMCPHTRHTPHARIPSYSSYSHTPARILPILLLAYSSCSHTPDTPHARLLLHMCLHAPHTAYARIPQALANIVNAFVRPHVMELVEADAHLLLDHMACMLTYADVC